MTVNDCICKGFYTDPYCPVHGYYRPLVKLPLTPKEQQCLHEGEKPGTISNLACPCPKCTPTGEI